MTASGHSSRTLIAASAIAAGAIAIATALVFKGFCVDDALIPIRYAQSLIEGHGYAFNADHARTDGVTPLVWAPLIAPLVRHTNLWNALLRLKVATVLVHGVTCALIARSAISTAGDRKRIVWLVLAGMLFVMPLCAWAASGMEIAPAELLIAIAVAAKLRQTTRALIVGLAAVFRPELGAFAVAYALASSFGENKSRANIDVLRLIASALLAALPFVLVAIARVWLFGHAAPLSVAAKPSDLAHGLAYAGAGAIASAGFIAAFAPIAITRGNPGDRAIAIACIVHLLAIVFVGGDSMPFARLFIPITPILFLLAARVASRGSLVFVLTRVALVFAIDAFGFWKWAPDARRTMHDRIELTNHVSPYVAQSAVIATLDIGWVAVAGGSAQIVDLAGVTDPEIAYLPGGHTSKEVSPSMLEARHVDTLIMLEKEGFPARVVEARLVASDFVNSHFTKVATIPLGQTGLAYAIYRAHEIAP